MCKYKCGNYNKKESQKHCLPLYKVSPAEFLSLEAGARQKIRAIRSKTEAMRKPEPDRGYAQIVSPLLET